MWNSNSGSGGTLNIAGGSGAGAGTQTLGRVSGGSGATGRADASETYNGTSWTTSSSLLNGRNKVAGGGTQSLTLIFGGTPTPTATEEYNAGGPTTFTVETN